ncbi:MAG: FAD-dependent oxidoreductase [Clostridiales bacterium]|nr:FAD-dependent oxidoreductase [Clostridiales bacterium]
MALPRFNVINAASFEQAADTLKEKGKKAKAIGGGTDLLHGFKDYIYPEYPDTVINLRTAADGYIREEDDGVHIGALTAIHDIEISGLLKNNYSALAEAAATVASPQIRNASTVGGNICQEPRCWYYRNAENLFFCLRKGGDDCPAFTGRNDIHSIFGAGKVCASPCETECPNGTPIPAYMELIRKGDMDGAARLFLSVSPLSPMTGRVCPATCRESCNREGFDEGVSIRDIERFLGDYTLKNADRLVPLPMPETGKRVAVIGAGPAGLAAAYYLRLSGNEVTVYDRNEKAGGMLIYGIPAYRLPKDIVEKNVEMIASTGVEFRLGVEIGGDVTLESLKEGYDAVLLCIGAWTSAGIGCNGDGADGVIGGIDFLRRIADMEDVGVSGKAVGVVGGGNTAMDACRSAARLGAAKVYNFYRRGREEMPADEAEIEEALEEGIEFMYLVSPHEIISEGGRLKKVVLQKMALGEPDESGRRRPVPVEGAFEEADVDILVSAVGQGVDAAGFEAAGLTKRGWILADDETYMTAAEGVFSAGDCAQGPETAVKAIAHARKAASAVNGYLGSVPAPADSAGQGLLTFDKGCTEHSERMAQENKPVPERTLYEEDIPTAPFDDIRKEAGRCFDCGCVAACPSDLAPALVALDAKIVTTERSIPAEEFFAAGIQASTVLGEGELVKEVVLPKAGKGERSAYLKYRHRKAIDFPLFSVAVSLVMDGEKVSCARIALGAAAPVPLRAVAAEDLMAGKVLSEGLAAEAAEAALNGAAALSENGYKVTAAKAYVRRAVESLVQT